MRRMAGRNPTFIIFLVLMLINAIRAGRFADPRAWLMNTLISLPAIVIAITFHEFMHAFSAWKLGDMTPKAQKRVTLNPLSHIDPIGIIALIFAGFGWGRPVQVNPYAFRKNPRLANFIVNIAGISMNFVLAFFFIPLLLLYPYGILGSILYYIVVFNIVLMLFNLLPIPPLDGFGIVTELFGLRQFSWYRTVYSYGSYILMFFLFLGIAGMILNPALNGLIGFGQGIGQRPGILIRIWVAILR